MYTIVIKEIKEVTRSMKLGLSLIYNTIEEFLDTIIYRL